MQSIAFVTGGAGFIGGAMAQLLAIRGYRVVVIDDFSAKRIPSFGGNYDIIAADITDYAAVERGLKRSGYLTSSNETRLFFHFAGHYANELSLKEPVRDVEVNFTGTMVALEMARMLTCRTFMYASSSGVYGGAGSYFNEDSPPEPSTPYEVSKYSGELLSRGYCQLYGMHLVAPRFFNVYGPGDLPGEFRAVIPNFIRRALQGLPLHVTGAGASRDFTYIDDVCAAVMDAVDQALFIGLPNFAPPEAYVFNICTGHETFIEDLAVIIADVFSPDGNKSQVEVETKRFWDNAVRRVGSPDRFQSLFPESFGRMRGIGQGLRSAYVWYSDVCR